MKTLKYVNLDVEDPINDRAKGGNRRYMLTKDERTVIKRRKLSQQALDIFVSGGYSINEVGEELGLSNDEIHSMFLHGSPDMKKAVISRAIEMFLDVDQAHSRDDIQDTLGITQRELRTLLKSEEFEEAYNEYFLDLVSHPTIKAVQHKLVEELLPQAFIELRALLNADSENVRMKVIFKIFEMAGVRPVEQSVSHRQDLAMFLEDKKINLDVNINIPDSYSDAIDAVAVDAPAEPTDDAHNPDRSHNLLEDETPQ